MATSSNPLFNPLASLLSRVVNSGLQLDPQGRRRLSQFNGRRLGVALDFPAVDGALVINQGELQIDDNIDGAHVVVSGSLPVLTAWFLSGGKATGPQGSSVEIEGDITVLQEFQQIFAAFRPSFATPLDNFLGTTRADQLLGFKDLAEGVLKSAGEAIGYRVSHSLDQQFVNQIEFDTLLDGIDQLRLRVDRLSANMALKENG